MTFLKRLSPEWQQYVKACKASFIKTGQCQAGIVSEEIMASWQRSKLAGVNPYSNATAQIASGTLTTLCFKNSELIECARRIFDHMFSGYTHYAFSMALADANGVTIAAFTPKNVSETYPETITGMESLENIVGTNGIGTCLVAGKAVQILGHEHYQERFCDWACACAPVVDETGRIIAVFNVGQKLENFHNHTFGMVQSAAYAITEQMRLHSLLRRQDKMMDLLNGGILIYGRDGQIRAMNSNAQRMLNLPSRACKELKDIFSDDAFIEFLLKVRENIPDTETVFPLKKNKKQLYYSILSDKGGEEIYLILREPQVMHKLAANMSGNNASYTFKSIVGESDKLRRALEEANIAARSNTTVLLLGESGTGKELFAQAIHNASNRSTAAFITVNCGAIPRSLLESELFGYEGGAFTGAQRNGKAGKFELAAGGTIFLDEIGEMPLDSQVALLHLLQSGMFTRVGGALQQWADVRVIAATNRDLEAMVNAGKFRADLFYRLSAYPVVIPPLRERRGDVILLAHKFLETFSRTLQKKIEGFSNDVLVALENYNWPGNVRELENVIERMVNISSQGWLNAQLLPEKILRVTETGTAIRSGSNSILKTAVQDRESLVIEDILLKNGGNMKAAAAKLGISRPCLYKKLKRLGLDIDEIRAKNAQKTKLFVEKDG